MSNSLKAFIKTLADATPESTGLLDNPWHNPWRQSCAIHEPLQASKTAPLERCKRLEAHLGNPAIQLLLLGEAPGYQGARYSGIPFTSERLLLEGAIPGVPSLTGRITTRKLSFAEPSATIVWGAAKGLGIEQRIALWNAFPFHPMRAEANPLTNRTPTPAELTYGGGILTMLLEALPQGVRLVAVGRNAARTLQSLGHSLPDDHLVRHPANGGATEFREGLARLAQDHLGAAAPLAPWVT